MKLFLRYLQSKLGVILLFLAFGAVLAFSFVLYRLPAEAVLYPAALCVLLGVGVLLLDFFRVRRRHMVLRDLKEIDEARTRSETDMAAMVDYYTLWVHQIKTPIAAMRLRLQDEDSELSRALLSDLGRIERYVSMVLTYLRLENGATDYVIKETDLDSVIRPVLRQFAGEFISRKLKLDYTPVERKVLTDGKWLSFVVEQVLSNALKYTPSGSVSISMEEPAVLVIRDTGIGIPPEDLPRVFERNYTGLAGRADTRASGIGLSLCKSVCDRLGHTISIESTPGEGTSVRIDLSARKLEIE